MIENNDVSILNPNLFDTGKSVSNDLGLSHLHVGWYKEQEDPLENAAINIMKRMDRLIPRIKKSSKVLILGSRYGSAARFLVDKYGCKVDCIHRHEDQMKVSQRINKKAEFEEKVQAVQGPLYKIPFPGDHYDVVWSQDQLFPVKEKMKLFREVYRVLKAEGRFIFTDIMLSDSFQITDEITKTGLPFEDIYSEEKYQRMASRVDFEPVFKRLLTDSFNHHLSLVHQRNEETGNPSSSIEQWMELSKDNLLEWGILQFQKRND